MKIGAYLPHWSTAADGAPPTWRDVADAAQTAESIGLDSAWVIGHHYLPFENGDVWSLLDPWSVLAGVAAVTTRIELGPLVACTAYGNPAVIARAAATIDEMSGGRLVLGLGGGYFDAEFNALGIPSGRRVDRFAEAVDIVATLLRSGTVDVDGSHHRAALDLGLATARPSGPPILIGASGPRMMHLTARYADLWNGWLPFSTDPIGDLRGMQRALDEACTEVGRDPSTLGRTVTVAVALLGRTISFGPHVMPPIGRSTGEIAEVLRSLERENVDHVQLCLAPATSIGLAAFAPVLDELDRE